MLGVGDYSQLWVVRAGSEDTVFIAWINTALGFTVCTFLLHFRNSFPIYTGLPRVCFALNLSDTWLLMAIRASDKSLLWTAVPPAVPELCSLWFHWCNSDHSPCKEILWGARRTVSFEFQTTAGDLLWTKIQFLLSRVHLLGQEQLRGSYCSLFAGARHSRSFVFVGAENPLSLDTEAAFCKLILWTTRLPGKCPQQLGLELLVCKEDAAQNSALLSSVLCTQRHFYLLLLPMVAFQTIPWPLMMQFLMKFIFS